MTDQYSIWVKQDLEGDEDEAQYFKLRTFLDRRLAQLFMPYAKRYFELNEDFGVDNLFMKLDGEPIYQITCHQGGEVTTEPDYYDDLADVFSLMQQLQEDNEFSQYDYEEVYLDEDHIFSEPIEI